MTLPKQLAAAIYAWVDAFMFQAMQDLLQFLRDNGLTMAHYLLFMQIYKVGPCGVTEIASLLDVSKPAASQMVDRLVAQGLISRREDPADRRHTRIGLTSKGRALTLKCIAARYRWLDSLPALTAEQQITIIAGLSELTIAVTQLQTAGNEK